MRHGGGRGLAAGVAGLLAAGLLAAGLAGAPAQAAPVGHDLRPDCGNSGAAVVTGGGGQPVTVSLASGRTFRLDAVRPSWWSRPLSTDNVDLLHFYAQSWLWRVALRAHDAGDRATVDAAVAQALVSAEVHPDNGSPSDFQWNEGANLWRERAVTCLYWLTGDARLVPVITATVAANLDPARYAGPPRRPPHNHGLFANGSLLLSAHVLGRPDLRHAALDRMAQAATAWVTPAGLGVEQSSAYHQLNADLWESTLALARLDGPVGTGAAAVVSGSVARAREALGYLVLPDGSLARYGDGTARAQVLAPRRRGVLVDTRAGVVAGRWSWSAPDDVYLARFGPPRTAHGHVDRGEVLWWATGRPVVVDPGTSTYRDGPARRWQLSASAHSTSVPQGARLRDDAAMALLRSRATGPVHRVTLRTWQWGVRQTRDIAVDSAHDSLTVTDCTTRRQAQVWQLDPRWLPVPRGTSAHRAVFVDGTGGRLVLTTTGTVARVTRGRTGLAGGWVFRSGLRPLPAARVVVAGPPRMTTRLVVTGPALRPWVLAPVTVAEPSGPDLLPAEAGDA